MLSSCRLYTDCRLNSKQVAFRLVLREEIALSFDSIYVTNDASSTVRLRSSSQHPPDILINAFSPVAHYQHSLRQQHWLV